MSNDNSAESLTSEYELFCCYKPDVEVEIYNKGMSLTLSQNLLVWIVCKHYSDVRMSVMAPQITCSTVWSGADQRGHKSSA